MYIFYAGFDRVQLSYCLEVVYEFPIFTDIYVLAIKGDCNWRHSDLFASDRIY